MSLGHFNNGALASVNIAMFHQESKWNEVDDAYMNRLGIPKNGQIVEGLHGLIPPHPPPHHLYLSPICFLSAFQIKHS